MGKNGDLIREAKKNKIRTFTNEQLQAHDKLVVENYKKIHQAALDKQYEEQKEKLEEAVREEWAKRAAEFATSDNEENFYNLLQYLISISCKVLVDKFGWKPLRKDGRYNLNHKLSKFCDYIADEINLICEDETMDIRSYSKKVMDEYGVGFRRAEE